MALYGTSNIAATTPTLTAVATTSKTMLQIAAATATLRRALNAIDQADATAGSVALGNFTAEPTGAETGIIDSLGANQRASYRWVVAPGGPGEIVIPPTNLAGIGVRTKSSTYVGNAIVGCKWRE